MKIKQYIVPLVILLIFIACVLPTFLFIIPWDFMVISSVNKVSKDVSFYNECLEESQTRLDIECVYNSEKLSSNFRNQYSFEEFEAKFEEKYRSCFVQTNTLFLNTTNGLFFRNSQEINDFKISDDVCVEVKVDLIYEDGAWKIDDFERF